MRISIYKNKFLIPASLLGVVLLWAAAAAVIGKEIILPGPAATFRVLLAMVISSAFWRHLGATLLRGASGFTLSYLAGLAAGVLCGLNPSFNTAFRPLLVTTRSTPSMSLILLALIWFRADMVAVFEIGRAHV